MAQLSSTWSGWRPKASNGPKLVATWAKLCIPKPVRPRSRVCTIVGLGLFGSAFASRCTPWPSGWRRIDGFLLSAGRPHPPSLARRQHPVGQDAPLEAASC